MSGGNVPLVQRLFAQSQRVLAIVRRRLIAKKDVETTHEIPIIGP